MKHKIWRTIQNVQFNVVFFNQNNESLLHSSIHKYKPCIIILKMTKKLSVHTQLL